MGTFCRFQHGEPADSEPECSEFKSDNANKNKKRHCGNREKFAGETKSHGRQHILSVSGFTKVDGNGERYGDDIENYIGKNSCEFLFDI